MEQCRLCKCTDKPLKESHIIPKMFYNELKRNSPTHIMRMADNPNRGVQDGLKLPFCVVNAKNCLANMKELFQIGFIKRLSQMMAKLSLNLKMMHFPIFYCLLLGE